VWRSVLITKTAPLFSTRSCPAGECARARHTFYICFICLSYHKRKNMCQKCCAIGAACWVFKFFFWESVQSMLNAGCFFLSRGVFAVSVASELFLYACATIKANSMLQAPSGFFRSHVFVLFFFVVDTVVCAVVCVCLLRIRVLCPCLRAVTCVPVPFRFFGHSKLCFFWFPLPFTCCNNANLVERS
jgi:hypothetical protein